MLDLFCLDWEIYYFVEHSGGNSGFKHGLANLIFGNDLNEGLFGNDLTYLCGELIKEKAD